jgi:hypothetical protein
VKTRFSKHGFSNGNNVGVEKEGKIGTYREDREECRYRQPLRRYYSANSLMEYV